MLFALITVAVLPFLAEAIIFPIDNRMVQQPGLLRYPLTVSTGAPFKNRILRRQDDIGLQSEKSGFFYSIQISIGTPPQPVSVNFDTGSAELWVNPVCSKSSDPKFCQKLGRFNGSQSFVNTNITNRLNYGTGFADLTYGYDYVQIGSAKISQQVFGVATDSAFAVTGIMGAGPQLRSWKSDYPMVMDNLAKQGFIKSRAFSLDIRSINSSRGSVIFGGIDTKKFSGPLEKRPIIPASQSPDKLVRYWVYLDGISVTKPDNSSADIFDQANGQPVLLDSGYTVSALPTQLFNKIKDAFPEVSAPPQGDQSGLWRVPCSTTSQNGSVNFRFGKARVVVPYRDFIWKQSQGNICVLGVTPDDAFPVLGDTFLRAAYVVFDMDNQNVHIANNEDCGSALVAIGQGPDAVPSMQGDCGHAVDRSTTVTSSSATSTISSNSRSTFGANNTVSTSSRHRTSALLPTVSLPGSSNATASTVTTRSTAVSKTDLLTSKQAKSTMVHTSSATSLKTANVTSRPGSTSTTMWRNTTAEPAQMSTYTSTFTVTRVRTITSCPAYVTQCTVGSLTTEKLVSTAIGVAGHLIESGSSSAPKEPIITSVPNRPATPSATSLPSVISVFTTTKTYTITSCGDEANCRKGSVTTQVLTSTTYLCPESTTTLTIPRTHTCSDGEASCKPGDKIVRTYTVTLEPHTIAEKPTPAPGCNGNCILPTPVVTSPLPSDTVLSQSQITVKIDEITMETMVANSNSISTGVSSIVAAETGGTPGKTPGSTISSAPTNIGVPKMLRTSAVAIAIILSSLVVAL